METDKQYWHGYLAEYEEKVFSKINPKRIMEIGVLYGASIAFLASRFPTAEIFGLDWDNEQDAWPKQNSIHYIKADQDKLEQIADAFRLNGPFDLVIDDGSHKPDHQASSLCQALPYTSGFYIIEDIHTCLDCTEPNILNLLLYIQHSNKDGVKIKCKGLTDPQILAIRQRVRSVKIYKRTVLPQRCYRCKENVFDYEKLKCMCGADLYLQNDSMAAILEI